jgi:hypothetical protein
MARYWENDGKPIADGSGRLCLIMDPEDGTHPIKVYGRTKDEIFEKVARNAETAQQQINRMRNAPGPAASTPGAVSPAAPPAVQRRPVTADEVMLAAQAVTNGDTGKMGSALKTLLRAEGFDVDEMQQERMIRTVRSTAAAWEKAHPEWPGSDRNNRLLIDKAAQMVGFQNITAEVLDRAYAELLRYNMLFDEESTATSTVEPTEPTQTPGMETPRVVVRPRNATSYTRNSLRAAPPAARREPLYTRAQVDQMNSRQLRDKIEQEPAFAQWFNEEFSTAVA